MEAQAYQAGGGAGTITQNGASSTITETTTTTTYSHPSAPAPSYNTGPRVITAPRTRTCVPPVLANLHPPLSQENPGSNEHVPAGLRMQGEYAVAGGVDIDFHSDSAIVACGTIATAYPYEVDPSGAQPVLRLEGPGKQDIALTFAPDHSLIGSGSVKILGRSPTGEDANGNVAYEKRQASCDLGKLTLVTEDTPVSAPDVVATNPAVTSGASATPGPAAPPVHPNFATASKPAGTAVLTVTSGFPPQSGVENPLAGQAYVLLRDPVASVLAKSGAAVPASTSPQQAVRSACEAHKPECHAYLVAIGNDAATGLKADAAGKAVLPGVPAGTYYLTASATLGKLVLYWNVKVDLKAGHNSVTLNTENALPVK
jgi:hypothetical protein